MARSVLELQDALPKAIRILRYLPERTVINFNGLNPKEVKSADDLPSYLFLGEIDSSHFVRSSNGWEARWQGLEPDTYFDINFLADKARYEFRQVWCGIDGGFSTGPAHLPLGKLFANTICSYFPSNWDDHAKEVLEHKYQITYIKRPKDFVTVSGIPDGVFQTLAFPVAVFNLKLLRDWLQNLISIKSPLYPISAEAKLMFQAINYLEEKAPSWTLDSGAVFIESFRNTGLVPYAFPVKETANDGSSAWTLRRDIYVLFITLPFAGLIDIMENLATANGPITHRDAPKLPFDLQPFLMPASIEVQMQSLAFFDSDRTIRNYWQFSSENQNVNDFKSSDFVHLELMAESLIEDAEKISKEVTAAINKAMKI